MLTGDHPMTAVAIAHEVGIMPLSNTISSNSTVCMTAGRFDALSDDEVDGLPSLPLVIARCAPSTKVRMVEALHRRDAFCVMTGDGVNDSPALKRADVGIAMGLAGSDVAKDAADMMLTDDNFASIVTAVEEGRKLFDNIQKFIVHLLISNIAQVVLLLIGLAFRDPSGDPVFPLSPLEILWVNMITCSFLALGLAMEKGSPDLMLRPPHDMNAGVFTKEVLVDKMIYGITIGALCLVAFVGVVYGVGNGALGDDCNHAYNGSCDVVFRARATVFAALSFLLLLTACGVKHFSFSLFKLDPVRFTGRFAFARSQWDNRSLFWAVIGGFVITLPVIYIPFVNRVIFKHDKITWEWGVVIGCFFVYLALVESWKAIKRSFEIGSGKYIRSFQRDLEDGACLSIDGASVMSAETTTTASTFTTVKEKKLGRI